MGAALEAQDPAHGDCPSPSGAAHACEHGVEAPGTPCRLVCSFTSGTDLTARAGGSCPGDMLRASAADPQPVGSAPVQGEELSSSFSWCPASPRYFRAPLLALTQP